MQNAVLAPENNSGFHGYSLNDIYPGWSRSLSSAEASNAEAAEQELTQSIDQKDVELGVDTKTKNSIWILLGVAVLLVILFGMGR